MVSRTLLVLSLVLGAFSVLQAQPSSTPARRPALRVLVVTGGCCHDYPFQTQQLQLAVNAVADVTWTVVNEGGKGTRAEIPLYDQPNWARPYDVVVHNECFADTHDPAYLQKIVSGHEKGGTPAGQYERRMAGLSGGDQPSSRSPKQLHRTPGGGRPPRPAWVSRRVGDAQG